ncbi:MAG: hypothetical protein R2748_20730 [Bryobacterales bacterium]
MFELTAKPPETGMIGQNGQTKGVGGERGHDETAEGVEGDETVSSALSPRAAGSTGICL